MPSLALLPSEIVALLLPFLTGFDLVRLSHSNRALFQWTLAATSEIWRDRVGSVNHGETGNWKQLYSTRLSLRFAGSSPRRSRDAAVDIYNFSLDDWENEPFSFELWFALLPVDANEPGSCLGGVLLGAQTEDWQDEWEPDAYEAFVLVSPTGDLECSVGDERVLVAQHLEPHQWHHLALTFQHGDDAGTETVYVDGKQVLRHEITLASDWEQLYYMQLATGFIDGDCPHVAQLYPGFSGWYDFNGVIDSFHIYDACLSSDDVTQLAKSGPLPREAVWTLDPSEQDMTGTARRVRCTRPRERVCTDIRGVTTD